VEIKKPTEKFDFNKKNLPKEETLKDLEHNNSLLIENYDKVHDSSDCFKLKENANLDKYNLNDKKLKIYKLSKKYSFVNKNGFSCLFLYFI